MSTGSGHRLARNGLVNLLGQLIPALAAVVAIPILLHGLGRERFGLLTLGWALVGWFSLFDAGLGRATTRVVARGDATGETADVRALATTAISLLAGMGILATLVGTALTPVLVGGALDVDGALRTEARWAIVILLTSMPFLLAAAGARGVLEGRERFGLVNVIRAPASATLFLGPATVLPFSHDLRAMMASITATRILALVAFAWAARRELPPAGPAPPGRAAVRETLAYAGWTGLTNALGTVMSAGYLDRFLVGGLISVSAIASYATPFEVVTKLWLVPMALMAVFFPALARAHALASGGVGRLHGQALKATLVPLVPIVVVMLACTQWLLGVWLGAGFARDSTTVAQLIIIGTFLNALAMVPFTVLQACGRADLTAKRHLAQLPIYVPCAVAATSAWGIEGTGVVWMTWAASDLLLLLWLLHRAVPEALGELHWVVPAAISAGLVATALALSGVLGDALEPLGAAALLVAAVGLTWAVMLDAADRRLLRTLVRGSAP